MAQGKLKSKTTVPKSVKKREKGKAFTTRSRKCPETRTKNRCQINQPLVRAGCPIQSKKNKFAEAGKLKSMITKTVNRSMEDEMRSRAKEGHVNLSKAQQAVAKHHKDLKAREAKAAKEEQAGTSAASATTGDQMDDDDDE